MHICFDSKRRQPILGCDGKIPQNAFRSKETLFRVLDQVGIVIIPARKSLDNGTTLA